MHFWSPWKPAGGGFFPFLIGSNFGSDDSPGPVVFFSFSPGGEVDFWLRELHLWLALIPMHFWSPWKPAGGGFFPFLIGSSFGSDDSPGPVVFLSFSPGGMTRWIFGSESCCVAWVDVKESDDPIGESIPQLSKTLVEKGL